MVPSVPASKDWYGFRPGQIVRLTDRSVFKLGVVIGKSLVIGKVRIASWQNASRSWSHPQAEDFEHLEKISLEALSSRERAVVRRAQKAVAGLSGVSWGGGAMAIRRIEP
jgi:hypothetical protein